MAELAVVIPAYKASFLSSALDSIAAQTNQNFVVYVGDDASPHDLRPVFEAYAGRVCLEYTRFETNLGQADLVAHWARCVALSSEPWVWLFSDDDVMEPRCVDAVLQQIHAYKDRHDLYHFDVLEIDAEGKVQREAPLFRDVTPALDFALERFLGRLSSYAPDYVFRRSAWQSAGGFEPFPLAWCTDDATWVKLARRGGIRAVRGPRVHWRRSGQNITSARPELASQKLLAAAGYLGWMTEYLSRAPPLPDEPGRAELLAAGWQWLLGQSRNTGAMFWPGIGLDASMQLRHASRYGILGAMAQTAFWDMRFKLRGW